MFKTNGFTPCTSYVIHGPFSFFFWESFYGSFFSRIKQLNLLPSPRHQPLQHLPSGVGVLLHGVRGAREIVAVQVGGDVGEVAAAEVVGEAHEGVELVLSELVSHVGVR